MVTIDQTLTLADVVRTAVDRHPQAIVTRARQTEAEALAARGRSWIAGPLTASVRYQTDRLGGAEWLGDNVGLVEIEPTVNLPLWRPGQRALAREIGSAAGEASEAAALAHTLRVAGELRELLWQLDELERSVRVAERSVRLAQRQIEAVERMVELGELAGTNGLLARREASIRAQVLVEYESALVDARYEYAALTGLERRPPATHEVTVELAEVPLTEHPMARLAAAEQARRAAAAQAARKAARGQPSLLLGPRSERSETDARAMNSFGVVLSVPFGGGTHVRSRSAPAQRAAAAADAEVARIRRALELARHEADHEREVAMQLLDLARERHDSATQYALLARRAFELGELGLAELLRADTGALDAELELIRRESALGLAVARVNEAAGRLP